MADALTDIVKGLIKLGLAPFVCLLVITIPFGLKMFLEGLGLMGRGFVKLFAGAKPA